MDNQWERSIPFFEVDERLAGQIIGEIDARRTVCGLAPIFAGCRNSNYIVKTDDGNLLLRFCPAGDRSFLKEKVLCGALGSLAGMPRLIHVSESNGTGRVCIVYEYIEGEPLQSVMLHYGRAPDTIVAQAAEYAANIHNYDSPHGVEFHNFDLPPFYSWYDLFLDNHNTASRLGPDTVIRLRKLMADKADLLPEIDALQSLTHGDYRPANMLVDKNGKLWVVDWEFAGRGHILADIGQFFRYSICFNSGHIRLFQDAYDEHANTKLPANWYPLSKLRDLINPLQMLGGNEDLPMKYRDLRAVVTDILLFFGY